MTTVAKLERRSDRLAKDLVRLQDLKEMGVIGAKRDYNLTLIAYLDTQKELSLYRGKTT